jgi:2-phosphosulfolactate phosphatase
MGVRSQAKAVEDEACADYIESLLTGHGYDHLMALAEILADETARKFLRNDKPHLPPADPAICLQRDLFEFALRAERRDGRVESTRIDADGNWT